jgi:hypothetical protein
MPSPFPGMDPYLEGSLWMSVLAQLTAEIARQLSPRLRPRYVALTRERTVPEFPNERGTGTKKFYPAAVDSGRAIIESCGWKKEQAT